MIKCDRHALECDLAETYHIYDIYALPVQRVALFSYGLRDDARIKMKMSNRKASLENILLARIGDYLSILQWYKTEDGMNGRNRPHLIAPELLGENTQQNDDVMSFENGDAFMKQWRSIVEKGERNG